MFGDGLFEKDGVVYTPQQIADKLGVSRSAVINWLKTGQLHGFKAARQWRVEGKEVFHFLEKSTGR
jgi:excisionase family DNA binding protein